MGNEAMLWKVPVPQANVQRIKSENPDAAIAADDYERALRSFFQIRAGEFPRFDIVLLGLGPEAHTAPLFPGTRALRRQQRLVGWNWVGNFYTDLSTPPSPAFHHADKD